MSGQRIFRLSLYHKTILPFLLIIFLGIASTLPYGIRITNRLNLEKADKELSSMTLVATNYVQGKMDELLADIQTAIQIEAVRDSISDGNEEVLIRHLLPLKTRLRIGLLAAYDRSGQRLMGLGTNPAILQDLDSLDLVRHALMGINVKSLESIGGSMLLLAATPNERAVTGIEGCLVAGFMLDEAFLSNLAGALAHGVAVLSIDGEQMMASDPELSLFLSASRPETLPEGWPYLDLELRGEPYRALIGDISIYNTPRARVMVTTPMREILDFRNRMIRYMLAAAATGTLTVLLIGMFLVRTVTKPIRRLLTLTDEVRRGNLEVRAPVETGDEIGELTVSFNRMVEGLQSSVSELQSSRAKTVRYARELERFSLQLQREKKETETIVRNIRDGLVVVDTAGNVLAVNPEAASIIGCDPKACIGQRIQKALEPLLSRIEDPASLLGALDLSGADLESESRIEVALLKPRRTVYLLRAYPVTSEKRELLGWILFWRNTTKERETEEMKNNFLATVSHELRTPLTSIKGSLNLLLDGNLGSLNDDQKEFLRIAGQNSDRLAALVNNLLDLAKMEAGRFRARKIACDLVDLVGKTLSNLKGAAVQREVGLSLTPLVDAAPISADPERIMQLATNLVDNAVKFSPPRSHVSVLIDEIEVHPGANTESPLDRLAPGDYFRLQIEDQGSGIPSDQVEMIFDKFHQADMSSTRQAQGSGLGLAIARTVVQEHGGLIWAQNRPEKGSRFTVVLPKRKEALQQK